jgi:ribosomal protein S18 acetylase RimI-like enzyme
MPIKIISATEEHLNALVPLVDAYRQFYQQPSDLQGARVFIEEHLKNKTSVIFIAQDTDTNSYAGFTQLFSCYTTIGLGHCYILNDLYVDPSFRQRGIGEALLKHAISFGKEQKAKKLSLRTETTNHTAQRLYERVGWIRDEQFYTYKFTY